MSEGARPAASEVDRRVDVAPLFSVIMPVHDKVRHVEAAVRSVLEQTAPDFELIVVDDASTDGSREAVEAIEDVRIRRFQRSNPGPGGYAARNLGIGEARGAWLTFLDADDTWLPTRLERLSEAIRAFPDSNLHACGWIVATRDGYEQVNRYTTRNEARGAHLVTLEAYFDSLRNNTQIIHTDTVAIRRAALANLALFPADSGLKRGGDALAWLRLVCRERRLVWSPDLGARYFVDSDNMVTRRVPAGGGSSFTAELLAPIEAGLAWHERRWLRRAVNGVLWAAWLNGAVTGKPVASLRSRLFWRGAWFQALRMTVGAAIPPAAYRGLRRLLRLSWRRG